MPASFVAVPEAKEESEVQAALIQMAFDAMSEAESYCRGLRSDCEQSRSLLADLVTHLGQLQRLSVQAKHGNSQMARLLAASQVVERVLKLNLSPAEELLKAIAAREAGEPEESTCLTCGGAGIVVADDVSPAIRCPDCGDE